MPRYKKTQNPLNRLTIRQLRMMTPSTVKKAAVNCSVRRAEYALGSKEGFRRSRYKYPTFYNEFRAYVHCTKQRRYSYIRFFGPPDPSSPVWVWCNCQFFKYNLEYVLTMRNSSTMKTDAGPGMEQNPKTRKWVNRWPVKKKPPRIRNPGKSPYLCKHLWVASQPALKQTTDFIMEKYEAEQAAETEATAIEEAAEAAELEEGMERKEGSLIYTPRTTPLIVPPYEDL